MRVFKERDRKGTYGLRDLKLGRETQTCNRNTEAQDETQKSPTSSRSI